MGVVMNMNSYEIETDGSMKTEYGEDVLCSGWNPAVNLVCQQHTSSWTDRHMTMPSTLVTMDAEMFLQKMYACQR